MKVQEFESGILITPEMQMETQNVIQHQSNTSESIEHTKKNKQKISQRFSRELSEINYILQNLEQERIYEKTGARCDGYLVNNVIKLRKLIADLLWKIENDEQSDNERLGEAFGKIKL